MFYTQIRNLHDQTNTESKRQRRDTHETDKPIALMATILGLLEHLKGRLILDSACTQHLSPRRSDFVTFTNIDIDIAGIGDTPVKATGKGNIQIFRVCNVNGKRVEMILLYMSHTLDLS